MCDATTVGVMPYVTQFTSSDASGAFPDLGSSKRDSESSEDSSETCIQYVFVYI